MALWLKIIPAIVTLGLSIFLSTLNVSATIQIVSWSVFVFICFTTAYTEIKKKREKEQEKKEKDYDRQLLEKQELRGLGRPEPYINGLGENPLLKDFFNMGQRYVEETKFQKALYEYSKCLLHPKATASNKVAAHILVGICYYNLSNLRAAENNYKEALSISKRVRDKEEKLQGR